MPVFATPDFGASGGIVLFILIFWAMVFVLVSLGIVRAIKLFRSESPKASKYGTCLLLVSGLIPFGCCVLPPHVVRVVCGNYPIRSYPRNKIEEGMSADEVLATLGSPHESCKQDDGEQWYYWIDSFSVHWFCVRFGPAGRVIGTHGN